MRKLKEASKWIAEFTIIDDWTKHAVETLPRKEALEKYGECELVSAYTEGYAGAGFRTSVWIKRPGLHLGYGNGSGITLPSESETEVTFTGKSGQLITVTKYGPNDYDAWFRDPADKDDVFAGCATRGTSAQIADLIRKEV